MSSNKLSRQDHRDALAQAARAIPAIGPNATLAMIDKEVSKIMNRLGSVDTALHVKVYAKIFEGVQNLKKNFNGASAKTPLNQMVLALAS